MREWEHAKRRAMYDPHWERYAKNAMECLEQFAMSGRRHTDRMHPEDITCLLVYIECLEDSLSLLVQERQSKDPVREQHLMDEVRYNTEYAIARRNVLREPDYAKRIMPMVNPKFFI